MYQRQEIFNIIELFASQNTINFYTSIFENSYLSFYPIEFLPNLPIDEYTSTANINEISTLTEFLSSTNSWFSLNGSYVIADKGYDSKLNHNFIKNNLKGLAFIAMNKRKKKNSKLTSTGNIICEDGLAMHKDGRQYVDSYIKQKF